MYLLNQKEISLTMQSAYSDHLPFPSVTLCPSYINQTKFRVRTIRTQETMNKIKTHLQNFSEAIEGQPQIESLLLDIKQKMGDRV